MSGNANDNASSSPIIPNNNNTITIHLKNGQAWETAVSPPLRVPFPLSLSHLKTAISQHLNPPPSPSDMVLSRGGRVELSEGDVLTLKNEETLFVYSSESWKAHDPSKREPTLKVMIATANPASTERAFVDATYGKTLQLLQEPISKRVIELISVPYASQEILNIQLDFHEPHLLVVVAHSGNDENKRLVAELEDGGRMGPGPFAALMKAHNKRMEIRHRDATFGKLRGVVMNVCKSFPFGQALQAENCLDFAITSVKDKNLHPVDAAYFTAGFLQAVVEGATVQEAWELGKTHAEANNKGHGQTFKFHIVCFGPTVVPRQFPTGIASPAFQSLRLLLQNHYKGQELELCLPSKTPQEWNAGFVVRKKLVEKLTSLVRGPRSRVVLEGEAGSGKSTLCQYLARMWAEGEMPEFQLVIRCPLAEVAKQQSPLKILKTVLRCQDLNPLEEAAFRDSINDLNVLWLFDSLDKARMLAASEAELDYLDDLCGRNVPSWAKNVVITARPSFGFRSQGRTSYEMLCIPDFSLEESVDFVKHYFSRQESEQAAQVMSFLRQRGAHLLAANPMTLQLICMLLPESEQTLWSLFASATDKMCSEYGIRALGDPVLKRSARPAAVKAWLTALTQLSTAGEWKASDVRKVLRSVLVQVAEEESLDLSDPRLVSEAALVGTGLMVTRDEGEHLQFKHQSFCDYFAVVRLLKEENALEKAKDLWKAKNSLAVRLLAMARVWTSTEDKLRLAELLDSVAELDRAADLLRGIGDKDVSLELAKVYLHAHKAEEVCHLLANAADAESLQRLSEGLQRIGDYKKALEKIDQALALVTPDTAKYAEGQKEKAWTLRKWATDLVLEGRHEEARNVRRDALALCKEAGRWFKDHNMEEKYATSLRYEASLMRDAGDPYAALGLYLQAYNIRKGKHYPPDHPVMSTLTHEIGKVLIVLKRTEEGLEKLTEARRARMEWLGPRDPDYGRTLHALGEAKLSSADPAVVAEGETLLTEALSIYRESESPTSTNFKELTRLVSTGLVQVTLPFVNLSSVTVLVSKEGEDQELHVPPGGTVQLRFRAKEIQFLVQGQTEPFESVGLDDAREFFLRGEPRIVAWDRSSGTQEEPKPDVGAESEYRWVQLERQIREARQDRLSLGADETQVKTLIDELLPLLLEGQLEFADLAPTVDWREAELRVGNSLSELNPNEATWLLAREKVVLDAMKRHDLVPETATNCPRVAVCGSGGGVRAMINFAALLEGLSDSGLMDLVHYLGAVSGSTWALSSWITAKGNPFLNDNLSDPWASGATKEDEEAAQEGTFRMTEDSLIKSAAQVAPLLVNRLFYSALQGRPPSWVDFWGLIMGKRHLAPFHEKSFRQVKVYEQVETDSTSDMSEGKIKVEEGKYPFPVFAAITKLGGTPQRRFNWIEFTPYEVGSRDLNVFVPLEAFGMKINADHKVSTGWFGTIKPEDDVFFLTGIWGSAMAIDVAFLLGVQSFSGILDKLFPMEGPESTKWTRAANRLMRFLLPTGVLEAILSLEVLPVKLHNFLRKGPAQGERLMDLRDAGIDFNLPFPLLQRSGGRDVDILVAVDFSEYATTAAELKKACDLGYFRFTNPEEDFTRPVPPEGIVFKPTDSEPRQPVVLFLLGKTDLPTRKFQYSSQEVQDIVSFVKDKFRPVDDGSHGVWTSRILTLIEQNARVKRSRE